MAYGLGAELAPVDLICGPGNKWVTAAKSIVSGVCGIDMLAGPSEVLVIAPTPTPTPTLTLTLTLSLTPTLPLALP
jgi:histidinol dehydrogenase